MSKDGEFAERGLKWFRGTIEPAHLVAAGDLLIANTDLTPGGQIVGRPIITPVLPEGASISLDLSRLVLDAGKISKRFLYYALSAAPARTYMKAAARGSTVLHLEIGRAKDCPIPLPSLPQQSAIAEYLDAETDRIDALIAAKRRLIELIAERYAARIRHDLRALDVPWLPLKRRWRVIDCKHRTPEYRDEGYPVVSPGDATPGRLDLTRCHRFVGEDDYRDLAQPPRKPTRGSIIYSRNASIGIAAYVDTDEPFCMGQDVCLITSLDQDQLYLTYVLNSVGSDHLDEAKIGSTFSRVNVSQILDLPVPCPVVEAQREMARQFDAQARLRDVTREALRRQIGLLVEHREALITAAVTGDMNVVAA